MIRAAIALAIGFLIAICLIGFGLSGEEPYNTDYGVGDDMASYEDCYYDVEDTSFSTDGIDSSPYDDDSDF